MGSKILRFINTSFGVYNVKGIEVEPTYWMAGVIVLLIFMLLFTIARIRYLYVHWNLGKSSISMIFWGFLLALIFEGFLLLGGRTFFTVILGWDSAPKPIGTALDLGRSSLVDVLGVNKEIPTTNASEVPTYQSVVSSYSSLSDKDKETVREYICEP
jgi:hypothetical protein